MAMPHAYRTKPQPARRLHGLGAFIGAAWLLLPGMAWAHGTVAGADGSSAMPPMHMPLGSAEMFAYVLLAFAISIAIVLAVNWGAQALWRTACKTAAPFGLYSVAAILVSLLLAAFVVYTIHAFSPLFAEFGTNLPAPTLLLIKYGDLLPLLVLAVLFLLLYALRKSARRERYFAALLGVELALVLVVCTLAYWPPLVKMGEAV